MNLVEENYREGGREGGGREGGGERERQRKREMDGWMESDQRSCCSTLY